MSSSSKPLVTIGIPTYNRANGFLVEAIECALRQIYENMEIVVSDNCSSDNTEEVVRGFVDPRIRYFRQRENIGGNNNFNFLVNEARGHYFLLLHDDDLIDDDFIEVCMRGAEYKTDVGLVRTGLRLIDSERNVMREFPNRVRGASLDDFIFSWFADETMPYLCCTLFNTRGLREIGGFGSRHNLFQDVKAEFIMAAKYGKVDVEAVKASFRKHADERTFKVKVRNWGEDALELLEALNELASGECKEEVRTRGMKFFSDRVYGMAGAIHSPLRRYIAYGEVFRMFNYRFLPPPLYRSLYRVYVKSGFRQAYKRIKGQEVLS